MTITALELFVEEVSFKLKSAFLRNKTQLLYCLLFTFLWGFVAHGYMFANNNLSWDSLGQLVDEFYTTYAKVSYGRVFIPVYNFIIRGTVVMPWLIGVLSLLYLGFAAFFISKIFALRSPIILISLCGLLTVNTTVTSLTATYLCDLDADMCAMLLSVIAAFCWYKYKKGYWLGAIPLAISLGLYQSYISTTITLTMLVLMMSLLRGDTFKNVILQGIKAIVMLLCAGLLYYCAMKFCLLIYDVTLASGGYNSIDVGLTMTSKRFVKVVLQTYIDTVHRIFFAPSIYRGRVLCVVHLVLIGLTSLIAVKKLFTKDIAMQNKILAIMLFLLLPLGMNVCQILANNMSHDLMHYALWLIYLYCLLMLQWNLEMKVLYSEKLSCCIKSISLVLLLLLLFWNIRLANMTYFVKDVENKAAFSLYTKISAEMEHNKNYVVGETEVAFVGVPTHLLRNEEAYDRSRNFIGMWAHPSFNGREHDYFKYILMNPAKFVNKQTLEGLLLSDKVHEMPLYPAEGSIQMIDDILVVKLGEVEVQP